MYVWIRLKRKYISNLKISVAVDQKLFTCGIFLDLKKKAFGTVNHLKELCHEIQPD